jgi:Hemerythrin HHE cation binding domain
MSILIERFIMDDRVVTSPRHETESPGDYLVRRFLAAHDLLRADLAQVRALAARIHAGYQTGRIQHDMADLRSVSELWALRAGCLAHCTLLHGHHEGEDRNTFPSLLSTNPALAPVIESLIEDHRKIAGQLAKISAVADALDSVGPGETADVLVTLLVELHDAVSEHLAAEEKAILPTMRTWEWWPWQPRPRDRVSRSSTSGRPQTRVAGDPAHTTSKTPATQ